MGVFELTYRRAGKVPMVFPFVLYMAWLMVRDALRAISFALLQGRRLAYD